MAKGHRATAVVDDIVRPYVRVARPWQWYKQAVLLLGIVFSGQAGNPAAWVSVLVGVVSFCTITSGMYVFNDVNDREQDRNHPEKRHRPVASSEIPVVVAVGYGLVLLAIGATLAWSVGLSFVLAAAGYVGVTLAYTAKLKEFVHLDVILIAVGFVLRAVAGVLAVGARISPWLVVCTFLVALMLALGKRRAELGLEDSTSVRAVNETYTATELDRLLLVVISTLLMSYSLYTFSGARDALVVTLPFAYYSVFRFHHLVHAGRYEGTVQSLFTDRPFLISGLCWAIVTVAILYLVPEAGLEI